MSGLSLPPRVRLHEVGPRDGFQLERRHIPTGEKVAIINALARTGVDAIQVTSFVHPKAVPQLADAEEIMARIDRGPGVRYTALVPNLHGAQRALPLRADWWELMLSVTDAHSRANANRTTAQALEAMGPVVALAQENGVRVAGGLATALGCPFEGRVPYERLAWVVESWRDLGVDHLTVADTVGVADPHHVHTTLTQLRADFPQTTFALHLHDTRGMGLANALAGLQAGVTEFDASIGGLGGCPFAPGASGNIATEDLAHMLALAEVDTTVNLDGLLNTVHEHIAPAVDHPLEAAVSRAGPSWRLHPTPQAQQLHA